MAGSADRAVILRQAQDEVRVEMHYADAKRSRGRPTITDSKSSSARLSGRPPPKPVSAPLAPMTRWQGTTSGMGLLLQARPTAREALASPRLLAMAP